MQVVTAELGETIGADGVTFYELVPGGISQVHYAAPLRTWELLPVREAVTAEMVLAHPAVAPAMSPATTDPFALTDVVSMRRWESSAYASLLRPNWGRCLQFFVPAPSSSTRVRGWGLSRVGSDFSAADADVAAAVQPVLDVVTRHFVARQAYAAAAPQDTYGLTERELVVLRLLDDGLGAAAIAHRLGISPRTVQKHLEHAYRKLDVRDRLLATRRMRELHLVADLS